MQEGKVWFRECLKYVQLTYLESVVAITIACTVPISRVSIAIAMSIMMPIAMSITMSISMSIAMPIRISVMSSYTKRGAGDSIFAGSSCSTSNMAGYSIDMELTLGLHSVHIRLIATESAKKVMNY